MIEHNNTPSTGLKNFRLNKEKVVSLLNPGGSPEFGNCILAHFLFDTMIGSGKGILRLTPVDQTGNEWKAFTFYTSLQELRGHEEKKGKTRPKGVNHGEMGDRTTWLEERAKLKEMEGIEPTVLVIGSGQGGLNIAARLGMLDIPTLIIDRNERVGDNWRKRYKTYVPRLLRFPDIVSFCMIRYGMIIWHTYHFHPTGQCSHRKVYNYSQSRG